MTSQGQKQDSNLLIIWSNSASYWLALNISYFGPNNLMFNFAIGFSFFVVFMIKKRSGLLHVAS